MPYGPHTDGDRERMLASLGVASVDELFADIPAALRASGIDLPGPEPEPQLAARLQALAATNRTDLVSFLGAGVYRHWTPPAVDQLLLRGEWYTAYTPYQPEVSQGTLQSIYEYESLIAESGSTWCPLALRRCGRHRRGCAHDLPPDPARAGAGFARRASARQGHDRDVLPRRARARDPRRRGGRCRRHHRSRGPRGAPRDTERPVAGVIAAHPNFYGLLEPVTEIGELAHAAGALFVSAIEPVSLAVLQPPGAYGADIAAGEGQPLGIPPQYGGPYLGILASTEALVRQIPGRLVGMTTDLDGHAPSS